MKTYINIGHIDSIQKNVCPEQLIRLVIPVDTHGTTHVGQGKDNIHHTIRIQGNTTYIHTMGKQDKSTQSCQKENDRWRNRENVNQY